MKPESDGIQAEVVLEKLEARFQAALDQRGLRICSNCRCAVLRRDVRDVSIVRQSHSRVVRNIYGLFCNECGEIEFDKSTDSSIRYAAAIDALLFRISAADKWQSLTPKYAREGEGFAKRLWLAAKEAYQGYFAPLYMGAWLLSHRRPKSGTYLERFELDDALGPRLVTELKTGLEDFSPNQHRGKFSKTSQSHEAATIQEFKENPQEARAYLRSVLENGSDSEFLFALRRVYAALCE